MASGIGLLLILLGAFVMAIAYQMVSECQVTSPNGNCWDIRASGAFGFYIGAFIAILGTVVLVGPSVAESLGKLRGTGPNCVY